MKGSGGNERRRFPRVRQPFEARYRLFGDLAATWCAVTAINLSASGVRFRGEDTLKPGTMLDMQIILPGITQPAVLRGTVVWSVLQASGVIETGVEFTNLGMLQQQQVDQLVQFLLRPR